MELSERIKRLKKLAKVLTYKADIYDNNGRIFGCTAKFKVSEDGQLFHGERKVDLDSLRNGHGRAIYF